MPELPEVETTRRTLRPHVCGARVVAVAVHERRLRRPLAPDFEERLRGRTVTAIERRGKYLLFALDDGATLLAHLGMSGSLALVPPGTPRAPHDHVVLTLDRGPQLVFNDPRRFGLLQIGRRDELPALRAIGPDPLSAAPTLDTWRALTRGRRLPIKSLLMDQRLLAGIGNIYANEALYRAGIHPARPAGRIARARFEPLVDSIRAVLRDAIVQGGTTLRDFAGSDGRPGYFSGCLDVYGRAGEPCRRCGAPVRMRVLGQRATYYCSACQR